MKHVLNKIMATTRFQDCDIVCINLLLVRSKFFVEKILQELFSWELFLTDCGKTFNAT